MTTDSRANARDVTWPAAVSGLLFGIGLMLSGLADPAKVLAFLTLGPGWDPTLMFVMGSALAVAIPGFWLANRRGKPLFGDELPTPPSKVIDRRLVGGGLLFGIGWGLGGFCPGPSLIAASLGVWTAWVFVPAMLAGAALVHYLQRKQ